MDTVRPQVTGADGDQDRQQRNGRELRQSERDQFALLRQARQEGDNASLGALLEYYRPLLERLSARRVGRRLAHKVTTSEVTQIALVTAAQRFGEFRGESVEQFRAWLIVILENQITDHSRRFLLSQCRALSRETPLPRDLEHVALERPSQICSAREQVSRLLATVEKLPAELRTIVRMRYQQDLTFNEIAKALGIPAATARRRWLEAVEQIAERMV